MKIMMLLNSGADNVEMRVINGANSKQAAREVICKAAFFFANGRLK